LDNILTFGGYSEKKGFVKDLINEMSLEKQEGEKNYAFEEKLISNLNKLFSVEQNDIKQN